MENIRLFFLGLRLFGIALGSIMSKKSNTFLVDDTHLQNGLSHRILAKATLIQCATLCNLKFWCIGVVFNSGTSSCGLYQTNDILLESKTNHAAAFPPFTIINGQQAQFSKLYQSYLYLETNRMKWNDAKENCESIGGQLVIADSVDKTQALNSYGSVTAKMFIGARGEGVCKETFNWVDGRPLNISDNMWASGEPSGSCCVKLQYYSNTFLFADDHCISKLSSLCSVPYDVALQFYLALL